MRIKNFPLALLLLTALVVSACGGAPAALTEPAAPAKEVMVDEGADEAMMAEDTAGGETMMAEKDDEAMMADKSADETMAEDTAGGETMMTEKDDEAIMADKSADETMAEQATSEDAMMAEESDEAMMADKSSDEAMAEPAADDEAMMAEKDDEATMADQESGGEAMEQKVPAWFNAELTNVNTGQPFKMADFKGKVVLVETMAVWCPTCLRQQNNVQALHEALGERDDFISVALDIDPNEEAVFLQQHAAKHGFNWVYAVTGPEVAREIGQLYGLQFLNPPSAPMFIIDRHGAVQLLPFGVKDTQTLQEAIEPFLNET